jgi:hypothetical protein
LVPETGLSLFKSRSVHQDQTIKIFGEAAEVTGNERSNEVLNVLMLCLYFPKVSLFSVDKEISPADSSEVFLGAAQNNHDETPCESQRNPLTETKISKPQFVVRDA